MCEERHLGGYQHSGMQSTKTSKCCMFVRHLEKSVQLVIAELLISVFRLLATIPFMVFINRSFFDRNI